MYVTPLKISLSSSPKKDFFAQNTLFHKFRETAADVNIIKPNKWKTETNPPPTLPPCKKTNQPKQTKTKQNPQKPKPQNKQPGKAEILLKEERLSLPFKECKMYNTHESIAWLSSK